MALAAQVLFSCSLIVIVDVLQTHEARDAEPVLVNVDYGLYESPNPDQDGFIGEPPAGWEVKYHLNPSYCSSLSPDELRKGWGFGDTLQDRTRRFLCHIRGLHHGTEDCVLLASHQYTIHSLISLTTGQDPSTMNFPQGEIAELEWWEADLPEIQMASAMPTRSF